MSGVDILGYAAGAVTTFTFLPQVVKTWKEKSAQNVSLMMFVIAVVNEIMWIVYGVLVSNWVIILTNSVLMIMALIIIYFKLKYK